MWPTSLAIHASHHEHNIPIYYIPLVTSEGSQALPLPMGGSYLTAKLFLGSSCLSLACCSVVLLLNLRSRRLSQFPSSITLWRIVCDWLLGFQERPQPGHRAQTRARPNQTRALPTQTCCPFKHVHPTGFQMVVLNTRLLLGTHGMMLEDGEEACSPGLAFLAQFSLFGSLGWCAYLALCVLCAVCCVIVCCVLIVWAVN